MLQLLLIEDNPVDAQAITDALDGFSASEIGVHHVENLAALADLRGEPDVVLLDLSLGDSDGVASVRGARAALNDVPIVVLTADSSEDLAFEALREGAQDYLVKGAYSRDTLMRSIRYAIERHSLKAHLIRADRLAAVGQLAAGVAHEVSNPANFVLGSSIALDKQLEKIADQLSELAEGGSMAPAISQLRDEVTQARKLARENLSGIERIAKVTRELQNYSRLGQREISSVDVNKLVRDSANLVRTSLLHRAQLELQLGDLESLMGDESKLEQVVTNLLVNAIHAVSESRTTGGRIVVATATENRGAEDEAIRLSVEDNGCGIPPDKLRQVFEPFYTTKPKAHGTGLGLSMAREIVRLHGGSIECDSRLGEGTRFVIRLPTDNGLEAPNPAPAVVTPVRSAPPTEKARVLLVDDEPMIVKLFESVVSTQHHVVSRSSGEAALELLRQDSSFDLVVCDFTMPGMGGLALHAELSSVAPRLVERFIFCTGGVLDEQDRSSAQQSGNRILYKPVRPAALLEAINSRLAELG